MSTARSAQRRPERIWLALLLGFAALVRLALLREFLIENPFAWLPPSDAAYHWEWAGAIASGDWLGESPYFVAPLYAHAVALLRALGGGLVALYLAQIGLHLVTALLVARAVQLRCGELAAVAAAALFLVLGEPALYATRISPSTLQLFLAALLWWDWARLAQARAPRTGHALRVGAWLGLLALAAPAAQLLVPVYALWLYFGEGSRRARGLRAALGAAAALAAISPASLHNWLASGEWVPISANAGIVLSHGNAPGSVGIHTPIDGIGPSIRDQQDGAARLFEAAHGRPGSWREVDRWLAGRVARGWLEHPVDAAALFARKLFWTAASPDYDNMAAFSLEREHGLADWRALVPLQLPWLLGLALLGAVLAARAPRRHAPELALAALPLLVCLAFHYSGRFRLLGAPVLCGLAALALVRWKALPMPRAATWALALAPLPLLALDAALGITRLDFMRDQFARTLAASQRSLGAQLLESGDAQGGAQRLRRAIALDAGELSARRLLYDLEVTRENYSAALAELRGLVEQAPADIPARFALAWLLASCPDETLRDGAESVRQARELHTRTRGRFPGAFTVLAMAQAELGAFEAAVASARRGAEVARELGQPDAARELERLRAQLEGAQAVRAHPLRLHASGTPTAAAPAGA